jgi:hypothetical protein
MDADGYPTDEELQRIRDWPFADIDQVFAYVKSLWHWGVPPEWERDGVLYLATGGWSGNEDIINAMMNNIAIASRWICSARGGAHEFELTNGYHERESRFMLVKEVDALRTRLARYEKLENDVIDAIMSHYSGPNHPAGVAIVQHVRYVFEQVRR